MSPKPKSQLIRYKGEQNSGSCPHCCSVFHSTLLSSGVISGGCVASTFLLLVQIYHLGSLLTEMLTLLTYSLFLPHSQHQKLIFSYVLRNSAFIFEKSKILEDY